MKVNDSSNILTFEQKSISPNELKKIGVTHDIHDIAKNVVKINGKYYYSKICTNRELINELIGTYLCKLVGLDVVDYQIGISTNCTYSKHYYALSEIFYRNNYFYSTVRDYFDMIPDDTRVYSDGIDSFFNCETSVLDMVNDKELEEAVLKMTSVDMKMGQIDRHNYNVMLRLAMNGKVELEKLYDFGCAYDDDPPYPEFYCYDNPFLIVRKNFFSLNRLASRYPYIIRCAKLLSDIPLYDVLKEIEKRFSLSIEDKDITGYLDMDKEFSKVLRKLR